MDFCDVCSSQCLSYAPNQERDYRHAMLSAMCKLISGQSPNLASLGRIRMTTNNPATNQSVIAAPGAGKILVVRSLYIGTEDTNVDVQFFSRTGGGVNTLVSPNMDYLANAGAVLPANPDGWIVTLPNESLVVTTTGGAADLLGSYLTVNV